MSKSVNQVIITGRLVRDPELKSLSSGKVVLNFTLAVEKSGKQESAHFIDITAWDKTAELISKYTNKGSELLVVGSLNQDSYEKDGAKLSKISVTAYDVKFLGQASNKSSKTQVMDADKPVDLSDIPF